MAEREPGRVPSRGAGAGPGGGRPGAHRHHRQRPGDLLRGRRPRSVHPAWSQERISTGQDGQAQNLTLQQLAGEVIYRLTRALRPGATVEIRTPSAVATVRGTALRVTVGPCARRGSRSSAGRWRSPPGITIVLYAGTFTDVPRTTPHARAPLHPPPLPAVHLPHRPARPRAGVGPDAGGAGRGHRRPRRAAPPAASQSPSPSPSPTLPPSATPTSRPSESSGGRLGRGSSSTSTPTPTQTATAGEPTTPPTATATPGRSYGHAHGDARGARRASPTPSPTSTPSPTATPEPTARRLRPLRYQHQPPAPPPAPAPPRRRRPHSDAIQHPEPDQHPLSDGDAETQRPGGAILRVRH